MTESRATEIMKMGTIPGSRYGSGGDGDGIIPLPRPEKRPSDVTTESEAAELMKNPTGGALRYGSGGDGDGPGSGSGEEGLAPFFKERDIRTPMQRRQEERHEKRDQRNEVREEREQERKQEIQTQPPPKKRPFDVMTEAEAAEILRIKSRDIGSGVMGEREGIPGPVSLLKQSDNNYAFKVEYSDRIIETVFNSGDIEKYKIPRMLKDSEGYELSLFEDILKNSNSIKVTFNNGDVFLGKVERSLFVYEPKEGEYRYSTGEIFTGDWGSRNPSDEIPIYGKWNLPMGVSRMETGYRNIM
jgi:hypothetical protein